MRKSISMTIISLCSTIRLLFSPKHEVTSDETQCWTSTYSAMSLRIPLTVRIGGETSCKFPAHHTPVLVPACQILYGGFLMWAIIQESPTAAMWTQSLGGLHQNSLKWKLSLLPSSLPLFIVNQLAKSSEVKKCTFCCLWLTEAECLSR